MSGLLILHCLECWSVPRGVRKPLGHSFTETDVVVVISGLDAATFLFHIKNNLLDNFRLDNFSIYIQQCVP